MTWPLLAGSALKRSSWWSPIASKIRPKAASAAPAQASQPTGGWSKAWPIWTGRQTNRSRMPCRMKTKTRVATG